MFYLTYLLEKDETDYSGFESYVREKYDSKDVSFFPIADEETEE